jgi:hypothetical protein
MSLINIRRERKELAGNTPARPPSMWKLLLMLAVVLYLIWFLGQHS